MKPIAAITFCLAITNAMLLPAQEPRAEDNSPKIYVVGNVKKPGVFPCEKDDCTIFIAIAKAEGLTPYFGKSVYVYRKDATSGNRVKLEFNIGRILDRKDPDVPLRADDILFVPQAAKVRLFHPTPNPVPPGFPLPNDWPRNFQGE